MPEGRQFPCGVDVLRGQKKVGDQAEEWTGQQRDDLPTVGHGADFDARFGHGILRVELILKARRHRPLIERVKC